MRIHQHDFPFGRGLTPDDNSRRKSISGRRCISRGLAEQPSRQITRRGDQIQAIGM